MKQYFIQYHNADNMGYLPDTESNNVDPIAFDTRLRDNLRFFTRKRSVEKAIGNYCFLIVGAGKKNKKYFLCVFLQHMPAGQASILSDRFYSMTYQDLLSSRAFAETLVSVFKTLLNMFFAKLLSHLQTASIPIQMLEVSHAKQRTKAEKTFK